MNRRFNAGLALAAALALAGCESSPITSMRIEGAIAPTFANLLHLQASSMGLPPMTAADFDVTASCRKTTGNGAGSGEWVCTLLWRGPDRRPLAETYDLFVNTDGCYTAAVEKDTLGGPTLIAPTGNEVRNLLYVFEGCFDAGA